MKRSIIILVVALLSVVTTTAIASNASELIGTIVCYVEQIQEYPATINDALCENDREAYQLKMSELANLILATNDAIRGAGLPNTLNLWAVYSAITANSHCGVHDAALSKVDWIREELDRIGYKYGLFDTKSEVQMCCGVPLGTLMIDHYQNMGLPCPSIRTADECNSWKLISCTCGEFPAYNFAP